MADRVELAARRSVARLLSPGSSVLVAVSGGSDSMALLHLLFGFRRRLDLDLDLTVAHLDHGLRRGSRADRRFVEGCARRLGLACVSDRREVAQERRRDESPEEAARRVRRSFLLGAARESACRRVALGHTLDDQAETILMRLARGGGPRALTGMAEQGPGPLVRPLLGLERTSLRGYLERRGIDYRDDPSNRELRFDRNRVRRLVMPVLAESLNPRAAANLVRAAGLLRKDAEYLDELAQQAANRTSRTDDRGRIVLDCRKILRREAPLANRVAHIVLVRAGADPRRIAGRHIEALLELCAPGARGEIHLPGLLLARRVADEVRLSKRSGRLIE